MVTDLCISIHLHIVHSHYHFHILILIQKYIYTSKNTYIFLNAPFAKRDIPKPNYTYIFVPVSILIIHINKYSETENKFI